jgi:hypothetical protein
MRDKVILAIVEVCIKFRKIPQYTEIQCFFVKVAQISCADATSEFIRSLSHNGHVSCEQMPRGLHLDSKRLSGTIVVIEALTTLRAPLALPVSQFPPRKTVVL